MPASSCTRTISVVFALTLLYCLGSVFAASASPQQCSAEPFALPLRNCTFDSGAEAWGILIEVGTPAQRLCLSPSTVSNSTLLSLESLCAISDPGMSRRKCQSLRGGFYNESQSRTWTGASLATFNASRHEPTWAHFNPPGITRVGYDTVRFPGASGSGSGARRDVPTLHGYGVALNERGNQSNAGMLGLGVDSLFLARAVHDNLSPARGWSLFAGSQSPARPSNGEFVVGGYNEARLDGSLHWSNFSDMSGDRPCPLRTVIRDLLLTYENDTEVTLKSGGESIAACIEPYDDIFRFTPSMLLNWKHLTGFDEQLQGVYSSSNNKDRLSFVEEGLLYNASKTAKFSLTLTLENGYTATIPPSELQAPLRGWNSRGERVTVPDVVQVAIHNTPTGRGEIPTLGRVFLSPSVLVVDSDRRRFALARASPAPDKSKLVPFGCAQSTPAAGLPPSSSPTRKARPHWGVIVGPVVGGVAVIAIIIAIVIRKAPPAIDATETTRPAAIDDPNDEPF